MFTTVYDVYKKYPRGLFVYKDRVYTITGLRVDEFKMNGAVITSMQHVVAEAGYDVYFPLDCEVIDVGNRKFSNVQYSTLSIGQHFVHQGGFYQVINDKQAFYSFNATLVDFKPDQYVIIHNS